MLSSALCWVGTLVSPRAACDSSQTNQCVVEVGLRMKWEESLRLKFVEKKKGNDEGDTGFKKYHSNKSSHLENTDYFSEEGTRYPSCI